MIVKAAWLLMVAMTILALASLARGLVDQLTYEPTPSIPIVVDGRIPAGAA